MPKTYAQRFAELIAADPNLSADYSVQLYDRNFANEVVIELKQLGIPAKVDPISGILRVHLSSTDPRSNKDTPDGGSSSIDDRWPRRPDDRVDFCRLILPRHCTAS